MEAEIAIEYDNARIAGAISNALSPDNHGAPKGLSVKTRSEKKTVFTNVECSLSLPTFIATVDDILFSIAIAEKALRETARARALMRT